MIKMKLDKKLNSKLRENIEIRNKKYDEFIKNNYNLSNPLRTYDELRESCVNYSNVIVGSDQLWLPVNVVADYYTVNWVPRDVNKISFATSFGVSEIPVEYEFKYMDFLRRINYLSVREDKGVELVQELAK